MQHRVQSAWPQAVSNTHTHGVSVPAKGYQIVFFFTFEPSNLSGEEEALKRLEALPRRRLSERWLGRAEKPSH
jgi:hypothetical protein